MAENIGKDEREFGSVTSSQISFLKNCPFAAPPNGPKDTESDKTEVLGTPISPQVTRTPILSLSTPISLDSINDEEVFRTPPENASLSSAAESEPRARVSSEIEPPRRGGGSSKSKSKSKSKSPPVFSSPSLAVKKLRVSETNSIADPEEPVADVISPPAARNVKVPGGASKSKSKSKSPSLVSAPPSLPAENVRVLEMNRVSDRKESLKEVTPPLSSPPSLAASNVRVPGNKSDLDSSPSSAAEGIEVADDYEIDIPFKEVIEALLRNGGENLYERDERFSYVDILKRSGLKFP
ncbi:TPRXL protein [Hirschfeldia incana]|nr:TPRXL protein [Hirschfeldia incana]